MPDKDPTTGQFTAGNTAAMTHGARSARVRKEVRDRIRQEVRDLVLAALPDRTAGDLLVVDLLVSAMADVRQLTDWIDGMGGPVTRDGKPYKAMELLSARESRAMQLMDRLGFGPRARAQIMSTLGQAGAAMRQAAAATSAQERLRARVAAAEASAASNGHAEALSASEVTG